MDTFKIKALFKAIELGSLTKAADSMGYSQPAVTQMMRSLEESIGFSLLAKTNRPDVRYTSRDDYAVLSMVRHGIGISILPELVVEGFSKDFSTVPYRPEFYRTLGVAIRSWDDAGPLVRFLIQFLKENM